jgi:hypothetical protein
MSFFVARGELLVRPPHAGFGDMVDPLRMRRSTARSSSGPVGERCIATPTLGSARQTDGVAPTEGATLAAAQRDRVR